MDDLRSALLGQIDECAREAERLEPGTTAPLDFADYEDLERRGDLQSRAISLVRRRHRELDQYINWIVAVANDAGGGLFHLKGVQPTIESLRRPEQFDRFCAWYPRAEALRAALPPQIEDYERELDRARQRAPRPQSPPSRFIVHDPHPPDVEAALATVRRRHRELADYADYLLGAGAWAGWSRMPRSDPPTPTPEAMRQGLEGYTYHVASGEPRPRRRHGGEADPAGKATPPTPGPSIAIPGTRPTQARRPPGDQEPEEGHRASQSMRADSPDTPGSTTRPSST